MQKRINQWYILYVQCVFVFCRRKAWRISLRREDLMRASLESLKHRVVCSGHFTENACMCAAERHTNSRLNHNAAPTIFAHANVTKEVKERKSLAPRQPAVAAPPGPPSASTTVDLDATSNSAVPAAAVPSVRTQKLVTASFYKKKVMQIQKRLERKTLQNRELKLKLAKQDVALRKIKRNGPDLGAFNNKQRAFLNLQFRGVSEKRIQKYTAEEKDYGIALYHR
jgi:hypothetical protein